MVAMAASKFPAWKAACGEVAVIQVGDSKHPGALRNYCLDGAGNILACLKLLRDHRYQGNLSIECEGQGGPMIEKSLAWLRATLKELNIKEG